MKRTNEDVVGRPRTRETRRDAAGMANSAPVLDVASFRHALHDPMGTEQDDAEWLAEFTDFMTGDAEIEMAELLPPDPVFRERLRRRLWRTHVMTRPDDGGGTH